MWPDDWPRKANTPDRRLLRILDCNAGCVYEFSSFFEFFLRSVRAESELGRRAHRGLVAGRTSTQYQAVAAAV